MACGEVTLKRPIWLNGELPQRSRKPRTGRIVAMSLAHCLRRRRAALVIG
jgi:hypothetical protein